MFFSGLSVPEGAELDGPPLFAKFLANPELGSLLPFAAERPQALIDLAHCVDAYQRHPFGQKIDEQWWPWHMRGRMEAARELEGFTTQDILDVMFCECRADRHSGGDGITDPVFVRLANEVRRRVIDSRQPDRSQQELLQQPVFVHFRPKKDPRDLKILDPACGSSHFLLYCFDLLLTIYGEAWADDQSPPSQLTGKTLSEDYPNEGSLRLALPGLILRHNLHGIDIDPRCAQIGAFALWLRAQRAYNEFKIAKEVRRPITKVNIVVAEPMPGEDDLLTAFLRDLREDRLESLIRQALNVPPDKRVTATRAMADSLCDLVRTIWDQMKLAGEAGSLLRIDDALDEAIRTSRSEWHGKHALFYDAEFSLSEAQRDFWAGAESLVLHALESFARNVGQTAAASFRRGLFAEDATRGLAFIDVCRQKLDVVLMNPPFGRATVVSERFLRRAYDKYWTDIYACFLQRAWELTQPSGMVGAITSSQFMFSKQLLDLRQDLLSRRCLQLLVETGAGVLDDAAVETALTVLSHNPVDTSLFLDATRADERESAVATMGRWGQSSAVGQRLDEFLTIPGSPICYYMPQGVTRLWSSSARLEPDLACVVAGNHTFDDERFLRLWWEVPLSSIGGGWQRYEKGGSYAPFLRPTDLVCNWHDDGKEMRANQIMRYGTDAQVMQSVKWWRRAGITYPRIGKAFGPRILSPGQMFSEKGMCIFLTDLSNGFSLLALLSAPQTEYLLEAFGRSRSFENSHVANLPLDASMLSDNLESIGRRVCQCLLTAMSLDETTPFFSGLTLQRSLAESAEAWTLAMRAHASELNSLTDEIEAEVGVVLQLHREDVSSVPPRSTLVGGTWLGEASTCTTKYAVLRVASYLLGVALGRWSGGRAELNVEVQRLWMEPLPTFPPALASGALPRVILADDQGAEHDVVNAMLSAAASLLPGVEAEWSSLESVDELRSIIRTQLFDFQLGLYSSGRRRAPVFLQLATPSGVFSVWLSYQQLNRDTLFDVSRTIVAPKVQHETHRLEHLRHEGGASPTSSQRRLIEEQQRVVDECIAFAEQLNAVAGLWAPGMNDGVAINCAPLWRCFGGSSVWQKECKAHWEGLCDQKYEWSHMAMRLWPERVVPKCQKDRSLAIAHGLEELFWIDSGGRWRALRMPREESQEQERIRKREASEWLLKAMVVLAKSSYAATPSRMLWQALKHGGLDDQSMSLCLWPERVVERAAADGAVADRLEIKPADLATARARAALIAKREVAELPSVLAAVEAAFSDDRDFTSLWAALVSGQHDDQPLALVLWPERVIEKCLKDVALAETHGLRGFFWVQDLATQQWRRRLAPDDEVKQEVQRRFNRTVKDALAKFIEAPSAEGASSRRRKGNAAVAEIETGARPTTQGKKRGRPRTMNTEEGLF